VDCAGSLNYETHTISTTTPYDLPVQWADFQNLIV
jgi:hypothetical protein